MQKKADEKVISESDKYNKLYREIKSFRSTGRRILTSGSE
jgi:hypothetical protein